MNNFDEVPIYIFVNIVYSALKGQQIYIYFDPAWMYSNCRGYSSSEVTL